MNVLITGAGRRTSLLKAFREAVRKRGGRVFAGDVDGLAPALYHADQAIRLPGVHDPEFVPELLRAVERFGIRLLVPTLDPELPVLAEAASRFAAVGCTALISTPELVAVCGDKWETMRVFGGRGLRVPASWLPEQLAGADLPEHLFVKPRNGSASQHTYRVERDRLDDMLPRVPGPIIQEEVRAPEITIDALLGLSGRAIHYVPRLRIRAVGGESIQGVTLPDTELGG